MEKPNAKGQSKQSAKGKPAGKFTTPKRAVPKAKPMQKHRGPSLFEKMLSFFREAKVELKKITWPTRKQVIASTVVVLVVVFIAAVFFGLVDYALSTFFKFILSR